jgi:hypothetical protein
VVIRVEPIDDQEQTRIREVHRSFDRINARWGSKDSPKQPLLALERALSPCLLKSTLRWTREWGEIMRNEGLTDQKRTAALDELSQGLDSVTKEAFIHITANHYMETNRYIAALRELDKLPEHTQQSDSIRVEVLYQLKTRYGAKLNEAILRNP